MQSKNIRTTNIRTTNIRTATNIRTTNILVLIHVFPKKKKQNIVRRFEVGPFVFPLIAVFLKYDPLCHLGIFL